ncbi:MAG: hypothetical protein WC511_01065 [Candidatus Pacearchaeota archaeon]
MKKEVIRELSRDLIALGGIPFFLLVIIRVSINPDFHYILQFVIAGILFFVMKFLFKSETHSGLSFILLFFIGNYYWDLKFMIFATLMYFLLIASLFYLKKNNKEILKGILSGIISSAISYFSVKLIFGF